MRSSLLFALVLICSPAAAQLTVMVSHPQVIGQKAIVPLALTNGLTEKVESARAAAFLIDEEGKMVGQATRWIIGGSRDTPGLAAGATNVFNFVVASDRVFVSTNLSAKVTFSRVVLEGGKLADVTKAVIIQYRTR